KARLANYQTRKWPRLAEYAAAVLDAARRERGGPMAAADGADPAAGLAAFVEGRDRLARLDAARDAARARRERLVARAASASSIRDRIAEYEAILGGSVEADALAPTAVGID